MKNSGNLRIVPQGEQEIVLTRVFDAPRALVFDALTKPELLRRWLGVQGGWTLALCEVDLKVGGSYRFVWRHALQGADMGVRGVYREILPPERLVHTEVFDVAWYPGESLVTTVLDEQDGKTRLSAILRYESQQAREVVLNSPMEHGLAESYDKLAELLAREGSRRAA
jgi:uncharacterized protein YndB with AHSA1/START domain